METASMQVPQEGTIANAMLSQGNGLQLSIDTLAVLVGLFAMVMIVKVNRTLGGRIKQALTFFILGVLFNVLAILWSLFYGHLFSVLGMNFDMHQNLMSVGMIFFIISTVRFSKLVQNV